MTSKELKQAVDRIVSEAQLRVKTKDFLDKIADNELVNLFARQWGALFTTQQGKDDIWPFTN